MSLRAMLSAARLPWRLALGGSLGWGLAMGACAAAGLLLRGWRMDAQFVELCLLFAAGGFAGFAPALAAARFLSAGRKSETAFAAHLVSLALLTIGSTAVFSGAVFRQYYAEWHGPFLSGLWLNQFVFTILSGVYQFFVIGLPLFFPFGLALLLAVSLLLVRSRPKPLKTE